MSRPSRRRVPIVQVAILLLLVGFVAALLLPPNFGSTFLRSGPVADRTNLRWHYQNFVVFEQAHKRPPAGTGHRFILEPWIERVVEHNAANLDRYFIPKSADPRRDELLRRDLEAIWPDTHSLSSADTAYAGPGPEVIEIPHGMLSNGRLPLMADDNEFGPSHPDFTINVLLGDGNVREIRVDELRELGFDDTVDGANFEVGPDSPHPLLRMLEK